MGSRSATDLKAGSESSEAAVARATIRRVRRRSGNKLTAMLQVRNERGKYLTQVLEQLSGFVDELVIVDDASEDDTVALCRKFPKVARLVELPRPLFGEEWKLRSLLWQVASTTEPDWLLSVDADELYEDRAISAMRPLIDQDQYDWVSFRFHDFWNGLTHYRDDEHWNIHRRQTMTLVRYLPGFPCLYPQWDHHVPRLPLAYAALPGRLTDFRVKHLGWAGDWESKLAKYHRYKALDPEGKWGSLAQYESILDLNPKLTEWTEAT
ncbi:glycosyltransferase [Cohnella endophytica]|uniref:Glycosyltransferase n=2 Tax=Cohnella endophytica TaxID=2419778 RepID=A0A494X9G2_9BACL|nr:glycosyltransferase [Cohnella endophytica]